MKKIDYKKKNKEFYKPSTKNVSVITIPEMNFLMIDGEGNPNTSQDFDAAIEALYSVSFKAKFMLKQGEGFDYVVPPLEGLWWADDMAKFSIEKKEEWKWTLMIMQPDAVTEELVKEAMDIVRVKKNPPALDKLRFEAYDEGLVAQIMHKGAYADEAPTVEKLHNYIAENGYKRRGNHHEIYLSDPRRAKSENMRTVIRQPIDE